MKRSHPMPRSPLLVLVTVGCLSVLVFVAVVVAQDKPEDHDDRWQWLHGREYVRDSAECDECHEPIDCRTCHLAEYPHPERWVGQHGAEALRLQTRGCTLCHRSTFCDPCHGGVSMLHPKDYGRTHSKDNVDSQACDICHIRSADCDGCHSEHASHGLGDVRP